MIKQIIIGFDFCDIQNNQGQGECRYHKNYILWVVLCKNCTGQDLPPTVVGLNRTKSEKQIEINRSALKYPKQTS